MVINKKKRTCHLTKFVIPADHKGKIKENEKINKYWDLAREQKNLWKMKVTVIPIIVGVLGMVSKSSEKKLEVEIKGRIQIIALLKLVRILRRILET